MTTATYKGPPNGKEWTRPSNRIGQHLHLAKVLASVDIATVTWLFQVGDFWSEEVRWPMDKYFMYESFLCRKASLDTV